MLVYGRAGAGKTVLAASSVDVPSMKNVLMISAEGGEMSIYGTDRVKEADGVDIIRVTNFKEMASIKDWLKAHCVHRIAKNDDKLQELQDMVFGEGLPLRRYHTIIVDSLSEVEAYNMYDLLGIGDNMNLNSEMPVAEFKEYKQNNNKMQLLIRQLRDLPMHVIMTCHETYEQDETKKYHYTLKLTGQLSNNVQGFFDIVGWLQPMAATEDKESPRKLWVQPVGGKFSAKCRRPGLKKSFFDDPTMSSIMKEAGLEKKD